jgi:hypothetical protein
MLHCDPTLHEAYSSRRDFLKLAAHGTAAFALTGKISIATEQHSK